MATMHRCVATVIVGLPLLLAGCTVTPDPDPVDIDKPVDAFNAVGQPYIPHDSSYRGNLSTEVRRLQNARRLYELSQERKRHALERRQRLCRKQSDSRLVPIQGTPGKFVYCEPAMNTRPADDG